MSILCNYIICDSITELFFKSGHNKEKHSKGDALMNFQLDERLTTYMKENGHKNILLAPMMCNT